MKIAFVVGERFERRLRKTAEIESSWGPQAMEE